MHLARATREDVGLIIHRDALAISDRRPLHCPMHLPIQVIAWCTGVGPVGSLCQRDALNLNLEQTHISRRTRRGHDGAVCFSGTYPAARALVGFNITRSTLSSSMLLRTASNSGRRSFVRLWFSDSNRLTWFHKRDLYVPFAGVLRYIGTCSLTKTRFKVGPTRSLRRASDDV